MTCRVPEQAGSGGVASISVLGAEPDSYPPYTGLHSPPPHFLPSSLLSPSCLPSLIPSLILSLSHLSLLLFCFISLSSLLFALSFLPSLSYSPLFSPRSSLLSSFLSFRLICYPLIHPFLHLRPSYYVHIRAFCHISRARTVYSENGLARAGRSSVLA